jgi:hypothetical protein
MPQPSSRQAGAATLAVALVLLIATTIMSFALARASLQEQRILQNELRAAEAFHRAEAILEQAMLALRLQRLASLDWQAGGPGMEGATPGAGALPFATAASGEHYQYQLRVERATATPEYMALIATAESTSGILAQVRQHVLVQPSLARELPPMVLDGCLDGSGSGIRFFPAQQHPVAITTTRPNPGGACIDASQLDLQGGYIEDLHAGAGALWHNLFEMSKAEHRRRSIQERAAVLTGQLAAQERGYYWVDEPINQWPEHFGSPEHPVWIVFSAAAGCPALGDGLVIHGIVYYETGAAGHCDAAGWGRISLYGSLLVEGDLRQLAGGGSYHHYAQAQALGLAANLKPRRLTRIPGTWRDF